MILAQMIRIISSPFSYDPYWFWLKRKGLLWRWRKHREEGKGRWWRRGKNRKSII